MALSGNVRESFPVGFVHGLLHPQLERCLELHSI